MAFATDASMDPNHTPTARRLLPYPNTPPRHGTSDSTPTKPQGTSGQYRPYPPNQAVCMYFNFSFSRCFLCPFLFFLSLSCTANFTMHMPLLSPLLLHSVLLNRFEHFPYTRYDDFGDYSNLRRYTTIYVVNIIWEYIHQASISIATIAVA
ncbi:hypothetical protein EV421DRAFT_371559 [Armillaria borealis]|uniref:Uncharacterized protein n=1 Tax=Armillaria borealis TaxID=47425 RepID=A0AA39JMX5_9AGAR|nr:hypothetical protein EV421DRAFT_371559 [Armillaria borealis]